MTDRIVIDQCMAEHQTLCHVKEALQVSLDWPVGPPGIGRKLTTVRFTAQSLRRHLERLMSLEETGGYMVLVGEFKPNLYDTAQRLRTEHDEIRESLERIVPAMDHLSAHHHEPFDSLCEELRDVLELVNEHDSKETGLLQEAFCTDDGGEG